MRLRMLSEAVTAADVGHVGLDAAGLVPGIGEAADLTNAIWYAKNGEYLCAALSVISMVPELGDLVGKGTKYFLGNKKAIGPFLAKYGPRITRCWDKAKAIALKADKLKPYAQHLDAALKDALRDSKANAIDKTNNPKYQTDENPDEL